MSEEAFETFSLKSYCRDRLSAFAALALMIACLAAVLAIQGLNAQAVVMGCVLVLAGIAASFTIDFVRKRRSYNQLVQVVQQLEKVRHISAFYQQPSFLEGRIAWQAIDTLARASAKETELLSDDAEAYERYVELWVHEIKTPIAASQLILSRMKGPDAAALKHELERIELLVEQALYSVRYSSLSSDYSVKDVNLDQLVKDACKRNRNALVNAGVRPIFNVPQNCVVATDAQWLGFVLSQLIGNAMKYGATQITFSAYAPEETAGRLLKLEVSDNGKGISAADMPRIFERGFVGENGRAHGSATGMGLFLCARICEHMGLSIEAFSRENEGSRFVISLPLPKKIR